jgi:hypothetical protein
MFAWIRVAALVWVSRDGEEDEVREDSRFSSDIDGSGSRVGEGAWSVRG